MHTQRINWIYIGCRAIGVVVLFLIPDMYIGQVPVEIPLQYGIDGMPDRYGSKYALWVLPIIGIAVFVTLSFMGLRIPNQTYDPQKYTVEGHRRQIDLSIHLQGVWNVIITWLIAYIVYQTVLIATGLEDGLGKAILPIVLALIFIPIGYIYRKMSRIGK